MTAAYRHTQRAPLCLLLYVLVPVFMASGWLADDAPPLRWLFFALSALLLVLAASFHHLTVEDGGSRLWIRFGPLPLFRRSVCYEDIQSVEVGTTTFLDGWGIHMSLRGGWVWNLWGRDCVVVRFKSGGVLRIGTDNPTGLAAFLSDQINDQGSES